MPSSNPTSQFPLAQAQRGMNLFVADVLLEGADAVRLQSMGLCRGRRLELVKAGDPLIVRVLGSRVGLAAALATKVMVCHALAPTLSPPDITSRVA